MLPETLQGPVARGGRLSYLVKSQFSVSFIFSSPWLCVMNEMADKGVGPATGGWIPLRPYKGVTAQEGGRGSLPSQALPAPFEDKPGSGRPEYS